MVAIVQARMSSERLPGKVLREIAGKPMLEHVIDRAAQSQSVDDVIVATSGLSADDPIETFCSERGFRCFRGAEDDVLDRMYRAARWIEAETIVRLTGDCPLLDPRVIDRVVQTYLQNDFDYVTNTLGYTYPDGLDVEVFSSSALEKAWRARSSVVEKEHVTPYLRTSPSVRRGNVEAEGRNGWDEHRWTVDETRDLTFIREVYARLVEEDDPTSVTAVIRILEREPHLMTINQDTIRNEGYYRSFVEQPPVEPAELQLERSRELKRRAEKRIPSCSQTFSKAPSQFVQGAAPVFLQRGQGSHVWDVDGNEYIDYSMALGPIILGHGDPGVRDAVVAQLEEGTTFSLPHPLEVEVAELIQEMVPSCEMVRFGKNGSDATSGAVRLARAYTGRDVVACCGYHGWQDWYIGTTSRFLGVPEEIRALTVPFEYNDAAALEEILTEHSGHVACVIMEPVGVEEPEPGFLESVRELTREQDVLLIFDEIVTGFRLAPGGAQDYYGVVPDLSCFGKAMANGFPLSVIGGPADLMKVFDEIFYSFTFGGETASLAAGKATMDRIAEGHVIPHLWEQGKRLKDGYNVLAREFGLAEVTRCLGLPPRTVIEFEDAGGVAGRVMKSLFQQECLCRGILFTGSQNICASHSGGDIDRTLRVYRTVLDILESAVEAGTAEEDLIGEPVSPVFREP